MEQTRQTEPLPRLVGIQTRDEIGVVPRPVLDSRVGEGSLEPHRVELLGVLPALRRAVQVPHADEDVHALDERHLGVAGAPRKRHVLPARSSSTCHSLARSLARSFIHSTRRKEARVRENIRFCSCRGA